MARKRKLRDTEIEDIVSVIEPSCMIPYDTALSVSNKARERIRQQLIAVKVYADIIPELKREIQRQYINSRVEAGDAVGVKAAQAVGERQTQLTLNSIDWREKILYLHKVNGVIKTRVEPIGQFVDRLLLCEESAVTHISENRTEYLDIKNKEETLFIPSVDEDGNTSW